MHLFIVRVTSVHLFTYVPLGTVKKPYVSIDLPLGTARGHQGPLPLGTVRVSVTGVH